MIRLIALVIATVFVAVPFGAGAQDAAIDHQATLEGGLSEIREDRGMPAIGGIVMVDGNIIALAAEGIRHKGSDDMVTTDDLWHLGSITKSMTSTLAGRLVENSRLDWNTTLEEMLPDMAADMHVDWRTVTLDQLLTHTAGAPANTPRQVQRLWLETSEDMIATRRDVVADLLADPPATAPGTSFRYSNAGYIIAGHAMAQTLGMSWEEAMEDMVFTPLGLDSAGFGAPTGDQPWGHASFFGMRMARNPDGTMADNTPVLGPAGTVHMTLEDLATYANYHLRGERGEQGDFLSPETWQALHEPALGNYAKGWVVVSRDWAGASEDAPLIWHNGSNTMWLALVMFLPEKHAVMAFTTNDGKAISEVQADFFDLAEALATSLPQKNGEADE